ncbi:helix-turn-helix transcriptional regulator [Leifsonia sp. NPDC077715]|uniref:helix-turn-helix domain-containing protein n=1 Tax=Leifsonia sp. NPDC077715 TaxID=3155539 RepID=UPI003429AEEA
MSAPRSRAAEVFGRRVREARIALGMSQEDIAGLADMHVTNYGRVERGEANSELHTIVRLATALNVDPGELMKGLYGADMLPDRSRAYSVADFLAAQREHEKR